MKNIKEIIDKSYLNNTELNEGLKAIGVSKNHLVELFKREYSVTPMKYINTLRIEKAQELLLTSDRSILDIALSSGFGNLSSFYEAFRKKNSMTPKDYRKTLIKNNNIEVEEK